MTAKSNRSYNLSRLLVESTVGIHLKAEYRFHLEIRLRFDFVAQEMILSIEIDRGLFNGSRHTHETDFLQDIEKIIMPQFWCW